MSVFQQIEEEGLGGEWLGRLGMVGCSYPEAGHCCESYTRILNNLGFWIPGISWTSGNSCVGSKCVEYPSIWPFSDLEMVVSP